MLHNALVLFDVSLLKDFNRSLLTILNCKHFRLNLILELLICTIVEYFEKIIILSCFEFIQHVWMLFYLIVMFSFSFVLFLSKMLHCMHCFCMRKLLDLTRFQPLSSLDGCIGRMTVHFTQIMGPVICINNHDIYCLQGSDQICQFQGLWRGCLQRNLF